MDDEDFDDLLDGVDLLQDSSQESLTSAAANLEFYDTNHDEDAVESMQASSVTSIDETSCETLNFHQSDEGEVVTIHLRLADSADGPRTDMQPEISQGPRSNRESVLGSIEAVFEEIADALLDERNEPAVTLKTRIMSRSKAANATDKFSPIPATARTRRFAFPGKTPDEAWRFTVIIRILELMHEALRTNVVLSKRDIYYRDPALFGRQALVDRYIDDIAFTFGVTRSSLNVTAVAKGLLAGAIRFCRRDGSVIDASSEREGMLVPSLREILAVSMTSVKWILVIEKEASFRSIASSTFWSTVADEGVIMTGKGYPDIATRALLHFLSTPSPRNGYSSPPVHGLVDFDPDGLAILAVYKEGSLALSHENPDLRVPRMQWLGLTAEHLKACSGDVRASQGLLALTSRDRRKAICMLERYAPCEDGADDLDIRRALQTMLMLNLKAELQLLDAQPDGMLELLKSKFSNS